MNRTDVSAALSRRMLWGGRFLSGAVIVFLLVDAAIKLVPIAPVIESMTRLGYPSTEGFARGIGVVTLLCTLLYALPRTAAVGAVLLTGLLGGAVATHLRVGSPVLTHVLFGVYLGVMIWGGIFLRDARVRALIVRPAAAPVGAD
jgi:hypothetical protein